MKRTRNPYQYEITELTTAEISDCVKDFCIKQDSSASVVYLNYKNARKLVELVGDVKFEIESPFDNEKIILKIKDDNMNENLISIF